MADGRCEWEWNANDLVQVGNELVEKKWSANSIGTMIPVPFRVSR